MSKITEVAELVEKGKAKLVGAAVQSALDEGCEATEILNSMIDAMAVVGERFKNGEIFVPEMLVAARAMKKGVEVLKPHLASGATGSMGKLIIATVAGDLHDIGKNLVALMLRNYGYDVIDLGKDVPVEKVVNTAKEKNIQLIGLSALMTTTVKSMEETIKALRTSNIKCKVFVGGAVLTQEYADMIGADFYAEDAQESVRIADKFFNDTSK